jgi:hypothetical protein
MLYPLIIRHPEARRIFTFHTRSEYKNLPCARTHGMEAEVLFRAEYVPFCGDYCLFVSLLLLLVFGYFFVAVVFFFSSCFCSLFFVLCSLFFVR